MMTRAFVVVVTLFAWCAHLRGDELVARTVRRYDAPAPPTQQMWSATISDAGGLAYISATAVVDEVVGTAVWATHLISGGHAASAFYENSLAESAARVGSTYGWTCSARMRLPASNAYFADGAPALMLQTPTVAYALRFDATEALTAVIVAETNLSSQFPASPEGLTYVSDISYSNYHWYTIAYCPSSRLAQVMIDGVVVISNYPGLAVPGTDRIVWGVAGEAADARAYWQNVHLDVYLPRPRILTLLCLTNGNGTVRLGWYGASNLTYRVEEQQDALSTQSWVVTGVPVDGGDSLISATLSNQIAPTVFYRLSAWPQE